MNPDDADDQLLAGVDLHAWRVPPPRASARPPILQSALAPAVPKRPRMSWLIAVLVLVNAAIIALVAVIVLPRRPQPVVVAPAGGGANDALIKDLVAHLESEQRELEARIAEIEAMKARIKEMSEQLRRYEEAEHNKTVPKNKKRDATKSVSDPVPTPTPTPSPEPEEPEEPTSTAGLGCDEVSCVLDNYRGACCGQFRKNAPPSRRGPFTVLEPLDRRAISAGVASVKGAVRACGTSTTPKGTVKVRVVVADTGRVTSVRVDATPDEELGRCVANAMQRAVFIRTSEGGSFSYPFVF
jgi:hypothetical protein